MKPSPSPAPRRAVLASAVVLAVLVLPGFPGRAANTALLGWNNLGMHCMDSDYSVFSILPPYNTIHAQLIVGGKLVKSGQGYTISYEAVADPDGSFNATAMGKGNFYDFAAALYGTKPAPEMGLAGWAMPGPANTPQPMLFESTNRPAPGVATRVNWWRAEGLPISPYDDAGNKNPYPLLRLVARNATKQVVATSDIVVPVSDEMDCRLCHASGTQESARPAAGWVWSGDDERDFRLNILRLHDEHQFERHPETYRAALAARGYNPAGLYQGVVTDAHPALCASCHASEALGTASFGDIPPLTQSIHATHAEVTDPELNLRLDDSAHRAACYRCHPGSATKCLRGAMGGAIAPDGSMSMQCQSCHGSMSQVGSPDRVGWFQEPNCQSCHTGTATHNNGRIRYTSVFEPDGSERVAVNRTFATTPNTPAPGLSLYRFSTGHGGLQCSACHGSTHAEFPATHRNDNLRNVALQGHAGVTAECTACHTTMKSTESTARGGPHGMHPIGADWVKFHHDAIHSEGDWAACAACHGADFRGTELSRALGPRTLTAKFDGGTATLNLFQGATVGCYNCHNGPRSSRLNTAAAPQAADAALRTSSDQPVSLVLPVTGAKVVARVISQPAHGTVGLIDGVATYFPEPGFAGTETFTYAAYDGAKNSRLATITVEVGAGASSLTLDTRVPGQWPALSPLPFAATVGGVGATAPVTYEWDFGDGSVRDVAAAPTHRYSRPGTYAWSVIVRSGNAVATARGTVEVTTLRLSRRPGGRDGRSLLLETSAQEASFVVERTDRLGTGASWTALPDAVQTGPGTFEVPTPTDPAAAVFYRLRQVE